MAFGSRLSAVPVGGCGAEFDRSALHLHDGSMRRNRSNQIRPLFVVLATVLFGTVGSAFGQQTGECNYSPWVASDSISLPNAVARMRPLFDVRPTGGPHVLIVPADPATSDPEANVLVLDENGASIGRPIGQFAFVHPRAVVDAAGSLHMVWGEREVNPSRPLSVTPASSLWYARYSRTGGWTEPRSIYEGPAIEWNGDRAVLFAREGELRLAFIDNDIVQIRGRRIEPRVVVMRREDEVGEWRSDRLPIPLGTYLGYVLSGSDAHLMWVGPDTSEMHDANSVFYHHSEGDGMNWSGPVRVQRSGDEQAFEIRVFEDPIGRVQAYWAQNRGGGISRDLVRNAISPDGGRTWLVRDFEFDGIVSMDVVVDECGSGHVGVGAAVLGDAGELSYRIGYIDGARTGPWQPISTDRHVTGFALLQGESGLEMLLLVEDPHRLVRLSRSRVPPAD